MARIQGVVVGIVSELDPSKARIKVRFPWLPGEEASAHAPIVMPLSGKDRGMYFMPEVGDEVLVAFEHGDFDHPFVLGCVWNGVDTPPESTEKNRVIVTPGGHTLRFEDKDNEKKVILKSSSGHTVTLDDAPGAGKVEVQTAAGLDIKMDDTAQTITVQAGTKVAVQAPSIELGGSAQQSVLGNILDSYLQTIVSLFNSHTHPGQLAAGILPVTPMTPVPSMTPPVGILSTTVREV